LTIRKIFRALQSEPFNCSLADIRKMTIPMIRNLLETLESADTAPTSLAEAQRILGAGKAALARKPGPPRKPMP
jgi:hypothetical protein